jgi:biopolymer transport protein ExbD
VVVNITKEGKYIVVDQTLSEQQLIELLKQMALNNPGTQTVQIRADRDVRFRFPLTVIGICKRHDIPYSCTVLQEYRYVPGG